MNQTGTITVGRRQLATIRAALTLYRDADCDAEEKVNEIATMSWEVAACEKPEIDEMLSELATLEAIFARRSSTFATWVVTYTDGAVMATREVKAENARTAMYSVLRELRVSITPWSETHHDIWVTPENGPVVETGVFTTEKTGS
jgi:hypothetical protein